MIIYPAHDVKYCFNDMYEGNRVLCTLPFRSHSIDSTTNLHLLNNSTCNVGPGENTDASSAVRRDNYPRPLRQ